MIFFAIFPILPAGGGASAANIYVDHSDEDKHLFGPSYYLPDRPKIMEETSGRSVNTVVDQSLFRAEEPRVIVGLTSYLESLVV